MKSPCAIEGCVRDAIKRGMCNRCYQRLRSRGEIQPLPVLSLIERFTAGLERKPNGCLEWTGAVDDNGYGRIKFHGTRVKMHRLAWELTHGPIPPGMHVLHHCDNPPCCDAEKCLFLGTQADNNADMVAKGRSGSGWESRITHCPADHPYDEANTYITKSGCRRCRACHRAAMATHRLEALRERHPRKDT